jgi:hypothetical protein
LNSNVRSDRPESAGKPWMTRGRAWNIAWRTIHIGVASVLVGGHVFDIERDRLYFWLQLTIISGAALIVLEAHPRWRWLHEARGVMTILKLLLLCLVPWLWVWRSWLLAAVIVLASVGSHMPARFRYHSLWSGGMPDEPHRPLGR